MAELPTRRASTIEALALTTDDGNRWGLLDAYSLLDEMYLAAFATYGGCQTKAFRCPQSYGLAKFHLS